MPTCESLSRRAFLGVLAATPVAIAAGTGKHIPIGLELYSVRDELKKDLPGTLQAVAKMGYECVEFYAPYYDWTLDYAKQVRKQLDDLKIRCYSTHNDLKTFSDDALPKAIELNKALNTRFIVLAHPGDVTGAAGWRKIADTLNKANDKMKHHGLHAGYHNHDVEWKDVDGQKPIQIIAGNTDKSIMLQLDVGTCLEAGADPVSWIESNPGRIKSLHLKDWSPNKGYRVLFGEGVAPWRNIFEAAQSKGGVEYYLIEQEGSDFPEMETADRCLIAYKNLQSA